MRAADAVLTITLAAFGLLPSASAPASISPSTPSRAVVVTTSGAVRGAQAQGVEGFLGIP